MVYDTDSFLTKGVELANSSVYLLTFELKRVTANFNDNPFGIATFSSFPMIGHIPGKGKGFLNFFLRDTSHMFL